MTAKRKRFILCALAFVAVMLTGYSITQKIIKSCTDTAQATQQVVTLFDTPTLKVELEGAETRVFDLVGGKEYTYTTTRKRVSKNPTLEQMQARCLASTSANTDTVKIELVGGLIVVNDKTAEQIYYIDR